jgi:hypothetical protein
MLRYAAIVQPTLSSRSIALLQSALGMVVVMALAGCSATPGSTRGQSDSQTEGPACYRETKSQYEAAEAGQSPNAALLNIAAALASKDNAFENCVPATGANKNN